MAILTNENYVSKAENVIKKLSERTDKRGKRIPMVTTSKIRNLLAMTADIYNEVRISKGDELSDDVCGRIRYLKIRFTYEAGRDRDVKSFVEEADILKAIDEIGNSKSRYLLFSRYMEALIAYHKFNGGKD